MSRISQEMRVDARKSPEELEHEIDVTRAELEDTLEELEHRLSPNELFNQALTQVRRHGGEFTQNLGDNVKQNPVPTLLTSIGLAWLMAATRGNGHTGGVGEQSTRAAGNAARRGREALGEAAEQAKSALRHGGDAAREGIESSTAALSHSADVLRSRVREASSAMHTARSRTQSAATTAGRRARRARYDAQRLLREQPLLLGALGLAAGAIAGAALPPSRQEDEAFGPLRDRALGRAAAAGAERLKRARRKTEQEIERERSTTGNGNPREAQEGNPREARGGGRRRHEERGGDEGLQETRSDEAAPSSPPSSSGPNL